MPNQRRIATLLLIAFIAVAVWLSFSPRAVAFARDGLVRFVDDVTQRRYGPSSGRRVFVREVHAPASSALGWQYERLDGEALDRFTAQHARGEEPARMIELEYQAKPQGSPNPILLQFSGVIRTRSYEEQSMSESQLTAIALAAHGLPDIRVDAASLAYAASGLARDAYLKSSLVGTVVLLVGGVLSAAIWRIGRQQAPKC